jgi:hypothetical protein
VCLLQGQGHCTIYHSPQVSLTASTVTLGRWVLYQQQHERQQQQQYYRQQQQQCVYKVIWGLFKK